MSTVIVRGGLTDLNQANPVKFADTYPTAVAGHNTAFNFKIFSNNTRTAISAAAVGTVWTVTYNKLSPSSTLYVRAYLKGGGTVNGAVGWYAQYGSGVRSQRGMAYAEWWGAAKQGQSAGSAAYHGVHTINTTIQSNGTTGSQSLVIGWAAKDGGSNSPFAVWNPNNTDDARTRPENSSIMLVWEVEN